MAASGEDKPSAPSRILSYEWDDAQWAAYELHQLMQNHFGGDVVNELDFQRRLRKQMVEQGVIDPYEAAAKQKRNRKGGVAYLIEHLDLSGPEPVVIKRYVGITATSKEERFKGHVTDARRGRIGHNTDKSLEAAIRMEIKRGNEKILDKLFLLIHLDEAPTDQELSEMEGRYVAEFGTMTPHGYNIHPPGSLGGLGNAKPMSFEDDGELIEVDSFGDAWRYHVKKYGPDRVPNLSAARARHKEAITADWKGWSIARVFGVDEDQVDGRWGDTPCIVLGVPYRSLGEAKRSGIPFANLASRYYRLSEDQRATTDIGVAKERGAPTGEAFQPPHPDDPENGPPVTATQLWKLTGEPKSALQRQLAWPIVLPHQEMLPSDN